MAEVSKEDREAILNQWKTCVEMANSVSRRRDNMNNIFVTLNLAVLAAISFIWDTKTIALLLAGCLGCIIWIFFIKNFRELNKAKFDVINDIENQLPVKAFNNEWQKLKQSKKYIEGTMLEMCFPFIFLCLYIGIGFYIS